MDYNGDHKQDEWKEEDPRTPNDKSVGTNKQKDIIGTLNTRVARSHTPRLKENNTNNLYLLESHLRYSSITGSEEYH